MKISALMALGLIAKSMSLPSLLIATMSAKAAPQVEFINLDPVEPVRPALSTAEGVHRLIKVDQPGLKLSIYLISAHAVE